MSGARVNKQASSWEIPREPIGALPQLWPPFTRVGTMVKIPKIHLNYLNYPVFRLKSGSLYEFKSIIFSSFIWLLRGLARKPEGANVGAWEGARSFTLASWSPPPPQYIIIYFHAIQIAASLFTFELLHRLLPCRLYQIYSAIPWPGFSFSSPRPWK